MNLGPSFISFIFEDHICAEICFHPALAGDLRIRDGSYMDGRVAREKPSSAATSHEMDISRRLSGFGIGYASLERTAEDGHAFRRLADRFGLFQNNQSSPP